MVHDEEVVQSTLDDLDEVVHLELVDLEKVVHFELVATTGLPAVVMRWTSHFSEVVVVVAEHSLPQSQVTDGQSGRNALACTHERDRRCLHPDEHRAVRARRHNAGDSLTV